MEKSTVKNNKHIYWLIPLLALFFFSSFYSVSYLLNKSFNKPNNSLYIISKELNTINNNVVKKIDNNFDESDSLKSVFAESLLSLNSLLEIVNEHYNENTEYKNLIITSIYSNIYFYDACVETLNNRSELNSSYELNKFSSLKDSCINNYKNLLDFFGFDFNFANNMEETFDSYYISLNILIKENRDKAFKEKQKKEFIKHLETLNKSLSSMNEDLMPAILRIREEKRNLSVILDDIKTKEETFYKIKSNIVSIAIPDGCIEYYTLFSEYLNIYEIYLSNIKASVIFEHSLDDYNKNSKNVDKHYKNSSSKRNDVIISYDSYMNLFSN